MNEKKLNERKIKDKVILKFKKASTCASILALLTLGYYNVMNDNLISSNNTNDSVKYSPNVVKKLNEETVVEVEKNIQTYTKEPTFEKVIFKESIDSLDFKEINEETFKGMYVVTEFGTNAKWVKVRHTREWNNYTKMYDYLKKITEGSSIIGYIPKETEGIKGDCVFINVYKKPSYVIKGTYAVEINDRLTLYIPKNYKYKMYFVNECLEKLEVYEISIKEDEELYNEFRGFIENLGIRVSDEKVENPDMNHGVIINGEQIKEDVVTYKSKVNTNKNIITLNMYNELVVELKNNYGHIKQPKIEFNKEYVIGEKVNSFLSLTKSDAIGNAIVYLTKNGDVYSIDTVKWVSTGNVNPIKIASNVSEISNDNSDNLYVTIKGQKKKIDYKYTSLIKDQNNNTEEKVEVDTNIRKTVPETKVSTTYSFIHHKPYMDLTITFIDEYKNMDNKIELNKEYLIAQDVVYYEYVLGQSSYSKIYYVTTEGNLYYVDSVDIVKTGEVKPKLLKTNIVKINADNHDIVTACDKSNKEYRYTNSENKEEK